jgi:hypothetical protein
VKNLSPVPAATVFYQFTNFELDALKQKLDIFLRFSACETLKKHRLGKERNRPVLHNVADTYLEPVSIPKTSAFSHVVPFF